VKIAFVDTGYIANGVDLPIFRKMKEAQVVAFCDSNEDGARRTAHYFQIPRFYTDFEKMLVQENVDIVDICTPSATRASLTLQALRAGFNCLVEKPLALQVDEVDEVIKVANSVGLAMNLIEVCGQTLVEQHSQIKVVGDKVFVVSPDGSVFEYLRDSQDELTLISADRTTQKLLDKIAKKLGV